MKAKQEKKYNPLLIRNAKALALIHQRAKIENRSFANAAATTIIEALTGKYTGSGPEKQ